MPASPVVGKLRKFNGCSRSFGYCGFDTPGFYLGLTPLNQGSIIKSIEALSNMTCKSKGSIDFILIHIKLSLGFRVLVFATLV